MSDSGGTRAVLNRRSAIGGIIAAAVVPALLRPTPAVAAIGRVGGVVEDTVPRSQHTAVSLLGGQVLVAGGQHFGALSSAQIYDPDSGQWFSASPMSTARFGHAAALLADGRVLVAGGQNSGLGVLGSVEIYDPTQDAWFPAPSMLVPRTGHSAAPIRGGVLVTGGDNNGPIGTVEFFDGAEWMKL